ncbi:hypothetical protein Smp_169760 [Schistosoma mansoni]|uniref:hypothetical protein n=1 Tax=Schistosoma mansoni TaxID=6183 RepID=UPI00022C85ED|nr:hypothetical protein Smp_169760 [Schistosoma mansoni]|eukprot:XP_018644377.1 hypothetical protein Smp_169760 [Schistosoma mansoni]
MRFKNSTLKVCVYLTSIYEKVTFDLCDTSGRLLGLSDSQNYQQTVQSIEGGGVYILVAIEDQILQNLHDKSERYSKKKHMKRTPLPTKVTTSRKTKK